MAKYVLTVENSGEKKIFIALDFTLDQHLLKNTELMKSPSKFTF